MKPLDHFILLIRQTKSRCLLSLSLLFKIALIMAQDTSPLSIFLETSNGRIHYYEYRSNEKETIFLLHGIPGSSHCWNALAALLSVNYRVVIPDMLGFGESGTPNRDYYMQGQATAIAALYKKITADSIIVFGHDFGGPVALTLLKDFPEVKIKKLVLASTNMFTDTYVPPPMRLAKVPLLGDLFFWIMTGNRMGMKMIYKQAVKNKEAYSYSAYKQSITNSGMKYTAKIFKKSLANLKKNYQSIQDHLSKVKIPVLVLWGDDDPFFGVDVAQRTHNAFSNSILLIYDGTGHFVPSEQPQKIFIDVKRFICARENDPPSIK
jgi:pimeloyl-ACP methyl ester carboxylesterase